MMVRRVVLAALVAGSFSFGARAATETNYNSSAFAAAQQADKPILVEIDAGWYPICAKQRPIIQQLSGEPAFKDLMIFKVDFDMQKDVVRAMGANMQATLVAFHGDAEKGRSVGQTDPAAIRALVDKTNG